MTLEHVIIGKTRKEVRQMGVTLLIPLALIAVIVLVIAGAKGGTQQGGEDVIKNVYIYVVLFATLMMSIGGSVGVFMAVADMVAPAPYYQSYEDYRRWGMDAELRSKEGEIPVLPEDEIRQRYDEMVETETRRQVERAKNSLIKSVGWIAIPLPVFIFFSRKLRPREE